MMGYGYGWWMWLFGLLLLGGIVLLVVVAVRRSSANGPRPASTVEPGSRRARDVLDERYARGEISTPEYHERREQLRQGEQ